MAQLRRNYQQFAGLDTQIIVVGLEKAAAFREYWKKGDLPFIGLPDPEHHVLRLYGQEVKLFKLGRRPAQMLINKAGKVRFVHYGHSMSDIPPNQEIITLIAKQLLSKKPAGLPDLYRPQNSSNFPNSKLYKYLLLQ